ncbi:MAG: 2Fe-2S iron-sulfur cluster binding domain-containing protein [Anaerolineae bacterium]|nr:2Fe-2S iron-sulfur cluster binding domain-containing protein [Anaerolineae bacterium]
MWQEYYCAQSVKDVLEILSQRREKARVVAGATDLILELERGVRKGIETLIDVTRIPELDTIALDEKGIVHIGPMVTHNQCVASEVIRKYAFPLAKAAWEVGSPQIRNRGTIAGNLITASPANDTIPPLMALGANVVLQSSQHKRTVALKDFYEGVRKTVMQPDEMLIEINFPAMLQNQRGSFAKFALRQAQAISVVNVAAILDLDGNTIRSARITLGAVSPTIIHALEAEKYLQGKNLDEQVIEAAAELASSAANPINDIRSSLVYRKKIVKVITQRLLRAIAQSQERKDFPEDAVLLKTAGGDVGLPEVICHTRGGTITATINGRLYYLKPESNKTLLRLLREDAGLTGTKEGCAEGECGACTVFMDGMAVMSCLVPAPRAHGAEIITIEGLSQEGQLHPLQEAFIENAAVQCGYCTPGFIMSAAKLMEEKPHPTQEQIRQSITGNLCRCTGYYKIVRAIECAVEKAR